MIWFLAVIPQTPTERDFWLKVRLPVATGSFDIAPQINLPIRLFEARFYKFSPRDFVLSICGNEMNHHCQFSFFLPYFVPILLYF
jgi:hypothetical protein